jgi:hypothetical protein
LACQVAVKPSFMPSMPFSMTKAFLQTTNGFSRLTWRMLSTLSTEKSSSRKYEHVPGIAAWVEYAYGGQPFLKFGSSNILSCLGVQQGDPLGPLLFALALQPLLKSIKDQASELKLNIWFLDDGVIMGTDKEILQVLEILNRKGPPTTQQVFNLG